MRGKRFTEEQIVSILKESGSNGIHYPITEVESAQKFRPNIIRRVFYFFILFLPYPHNPIKPQHSSTIVPGFWSRGR